MPHRPIHPYDAKQPMAALPRPYGAIKDIRSKTTSLRIASPTIPVHPVTNSLPKSLLPFATSLTSTGSIRRQIVKAAPSTRVDQVPGLP